jgi:hypothetical protein
MYILTIGRSQQGCQMVCFQTKNPKFGYILDGHWMVNVGKFYDHLEHFMAIWYNLWPFVIACDHLLYFSPFGMFGPRKIWQPWFTAFETMLMRVWNCLRRKMTSCFSQGTNSVHIALLCVALITYTLSVVSSSPANEETGARIPPE